MLADLPAAMEGGWCVWCGVVSCRVVSFGAVCVVWRGVVWCVWCVWCGVVWFVEGLVGGMKLHDGWVVVAQR